MWATRCFTLDKLPSPDLLCKSDLAQTAEDFGYGLRLLIEGGTGYRSESARLHGGGEARTTGCVDSFEDVMAQNPKRFEGVLSSGEIAPEGRRGEALA